jgi:hypothetical protein
MGVTDMITSCHVGASCRDCTVDMTTDICTGTQRNVNSNVACVLCVVSGE